MNRPKQSGVALITAILVVAIASIAATALLVSANSSLRRSANLFESEAAWWYADGLEAWGISILQRDAKETQIDALNEVWAQPVPALPVDQGILRGAITDLHSRFNLNNLASSDSAAWAEQFQRLLGCVEGIDAFEAESLALAIKDWIDADDQVSFPGGAEDLSYMNLQPGYRTANQPLTSISEIRAVQGMSSEIYAVLRPHLAAIPLTGGQATTINLNTATVPVLCSFGAGGPSPALQGFAEERLELPLETVQDAIERKILDANAPTQHASVSSQTFELQAEAFIGTGRVSLYSVVARNAGSKPLVLLHRVDTD